jgi:hypothetical protein
MKWKPISESEFDALLIAETTQLGEESRAALSAYGIGCVAMQIVRPLLDGGPTVPERVFVVARLGNAVLFYDDVEEEFAVATVDTDEVIRDWSLWGSLDYGLRNFPRAGPVRGPSRPLFPDSPF